MNTEQLVSKMMTLNTLARLWHWMTDSAQHHVTYEQFLTQNETLTDSFVESALGNDLPMQLGQVGVTSGTQKAYSLDSAKTELKDYRSEVISAKKSLEESDVMGSDELTTILDDVIELTSKTLYLLKLK